MIAMDQETKYYVYTVRQDNKTRAFDYEGTFYLYAKSNLSEERLDLIREYNIRNRFKAISIDEHGQIVLLSRRGNVHKISYDRGQVHLQSAKKGRNKFKSFKRIPSLGGTRYKLSCAEFNNGVRIFLDSRGMIHLKSGDPNLAEVTILLHDGPLTIWTSDGKFYGDEYFIGAHQPYSANIIYNDYVKVILQRAL